MYYRPCREKNISVIAEEVRELITEVGHREITLASLSSGDFSLLSELIASLNAQYKSSRVSFALPSLKIDSFTLPILRQLSEVRKSGLTFAVETPLSSCQIGLNKEASAEKTISIIREAKKIGWRSAKFYFMVGLPVAQETDEVSDIISYLEEVRIATNLSFNVNIGTFIPKPFTPFQWDRQLSESEALDRIMSIKRGLDKRFYKIGYHSPFTSIIEGLISRGGEEVTAVVMDAYRRGARLDAWEDHLKVEAWRDAFASAGWDVEKRVTSERPLDERLPWDSVSIGASPSYLKRERQKAFLPELTSACGENCDHQCGSCGETRVKRNARDVIPVSAESNSDDTDLRYAKILFWYTKKGRATYLSHINVMNIFEGAFPRAGFRLKFSEGFNPKPKIEFAHPLALGIFSEDEVASVILSGDFTMDAFISRINAVLPSGFMVVGAMPVRKEKERLSLMAMYWGSEYAVETTDLGVEPAVFASRLEGKVNLSIRREEDRFLVRVQAGQGCESNIIRLCGEALNSEEAARELMIVRTRCLAKGDSGPVRYPEFFS
jgi:radical SAM-linked protein